MSPDVAIVGAGVIGCAIADALAATGAGSIVVIDRGPPGGEASNAAAGLLSVASSRAPGGALFALKRASAALFPLLAEALRARTGIDVGYSTAGLLDLAFTPGEAASLAALVTKRRAQGFKAELLEAGAAHGLEPALNTAVRAAAHFADDRSLDPVRLVAALHASAQARGVTFRFGAALTEVETTGGRVSGLTAGGERISPGRVVLAAGAWASALGAMLRVKLPVRPDKGQMVALRGPLRLARSLSWGEGYLVSRADGEIVVGSTSERGVYDKSVSEQTTLRLRRRAERMVPALAEAAVARTWAGLRPCSTIRRPLIGPLPRYANVLLATGHHRAGILLAPITAQLVSELIVHGRTSLPLEPFSYRAR